jgi:hypothetical protein
MCPEGQAQEETVGAMLGGFSATEVHVLSLVILTAINRKFPEKLLINPEISQETANTVGSLRPP